MSLYKIVQHAIGLYSLILAGLLFFGTKVIAVQLTALYSLPVVKKFFTAAITSSLIMGHDFLKKQAL